MGAIAQWRRAADRERRQLRVVDPELAAIKDREELEQARVRARSERRGRGLPQVDPGEGSKPSGCGCFIVLCIAGFILVCFLAAGPLNKQPSGDWPTDGPTTTQTK
jgi:hypothetical protein